MKIRSYSQKKTDKKTRHIMYAAFFNLQKPRQAFFLL